MLTPLKALEDAGDLFLLLVDLDEREKSPDIPSLPRK